VDDLRMRLTAIGHADMAIMNPLSDATVDELVERLDLPAGARVLDLGCGKAEVLIRIVERYGANGIGVELSPHLLAEARAAAGLLANGAIELHEADVRSFRDSGRFDLVIAMGPGWEHGTFGQLLTDMQRHAASGSLLLAADGYWRTTPTDAYLRLLGARRDEMASHEGNLQAGIALGMTPIWAVTASTRDWDRYEWTYLASLDRWLAEHPEDPIFGDVADWLSAGRDRYLGGGRDQLGFGAYLFRLPA
jgi:SAM-dependent methyltransferase